MTGLLLINLGTPEEPTVPAVRRYLREFLSDPRVIDINPVGRWLLLNLIILRRRPKQSAHAYQQVWTERGSPLMFHSEDLLDKVRAHMGEDWQVQLAMRYGTPTIASGIEALRGAGCERVVVLPLYPQWAESSGGTALEVVEREADDLELLVIKDFYDDPAFLDAFAAVGRPMIEEAAADHILFSFHGLPERHVQATDPTGEHCLIAEDCCASVGEHNRWCYRAQCYATARGLASRLELSEDDYSVCFQSRLGRTPWIKPYTDARISELAADGTKRLLVFCPAFVADCLETLEEIQIRARAQFLDEGGEELVMVPSLNSSPAWVDAVVSLARRRLEAGNG
jgi:ferrochelatase